MSEGRRTTDRTRTLWLRRGFGTSPDFPGTLPRVSEALELRIQCFNLDEAILTVHDGKGQKDRTVPLPKVLLPRIRDQFARVAAQRREDLAKNFAGAFLPRQLEKKYPNAGREFIWQWFFPAPRLTLVKATGKYQIYG